MLGGMPEIVYQYLQKNDLVSTKAIYESLLLGYQDDIEKYESNKDKVKVLRHVISSAPLSAGSRIKFQNFGESNYKSKESAEALRILEKTMLLTLVYPTTNNEPPFEQNLKKSPKLQFLDTGLVNFFCGLQGEFFSLSDLNSLYKGKIAEHIVGQELQFAYGSPLSPVLFWVRDSNKTNAEIDFVYKFGTKLIPIEVKSGSSGRLKSLQSYMDYVEHDIAIRLYAGNYSKQTLNSLKGRAFTLINLPYYLASRIDRYLS